MPLFWTGSLQSGLAHLALNAEFNEDIITRKTFIFIEKKKSYKLLFIGFNLQI